MEFNKIICGDCFNILPKLEAKSIDLILTDMPYNMTACDWDKQPIDLNKLWEALKPLGKDNCAYVFTASQPFTSKLVMSNLKWFKYEWVWDKVKSTGHLNAKRQPLRIYEDVLVFYNKQPTYNPQMIDKGRIRKDKPRTKTYKGNGNQVYGTFKAIGGEYTDFYPNQKITVSNASQKNKLHPTQKPVALFEYLIKTYTNEGDVVLDPFLGSGSTLVACKQLNRRYIGIEISPEYAKMSEDRLRGIEESLF